MYCVCGSYQVSLSTVVYPVLFSLIFSCLCCYPAEDQLSSLSYTSLHRARGALLRLYVCRFALCICTLNRSLNLSSCVCIPLAPSCKFTCREHFLLSMLSVASSRGKRVTHGNITTLLNSAGACASIAVTLGSVDGPRSTSKGEAEFYYARRSR